MSRRNDFVKELVNLGNELSEEREKAHDLWTWLPSYKVAEKNHGDYASEHCPSPKDVMVEAAMYIGRLRYGQEAPSKEMVDKVCFNIGNTHDQSELWSHMRKDPDAFRQAVTMALTPKKEYSIDEKDWFERCPCGEDHAGE
jgi:hypothetical protein